MRWSMSAGVWVQGTELFIGTFACFDAVAVACGATASQSLWWLDTRSLPPLVSIMLPGLLGMLLLAAAFAVPADGPRRRLTSATCGGAGIVALINTAGFYEAWRGGSIRPTVPVPFSLVIAVVLGLLMWWHVRPVDLDLEPVGRLGVVAVALTWVLVFPLAHVIFFGTTDYRRPADAVVVLGAKVWPNGCLTTSLDDRVRTAVELYDEGLVDTLIMSGATGSEGIDEALAMRDRAIELGVPTEAIITDSQGINTDATVANSLEIAEQEGFDRLMVVSQFYHLPRIELAYRAEGREVYTVPAMKTTRIAKTPLFVAREIPGFWVYWGRVWTRDTLG